MTKTVTVILDGDYKTIASDADYSTATIQVRGQNAGEIVIDERSEAQRNSDGDEAGIIYQQLESAQFSGWAGEIRARAPHGEKDSVITVILS